MKALSIQQPWAWLIVSGHKDVENRIWRTNFRGRFLIHAGLKMDRDAFDFAPVKKILDTVNPTLHVGGIIGSASIDACVEKHDSEWFFGPFGFVIVDPQSMPFRRYKGQLGFFDVAPATGGSATPGFYLVGDR